LKRLSPPQPLPHPVVDGHTHLDHARRGEDAVDVRTALREAAAVGVTRMVQIGCDLQAARWTVDAVERYPELLGGVALHPTEASEIVCGPMDFTSEAAGAVASQQVFVDGQGEQLPRKASAVPGPDSRSESGPDWEGFDVSLAEIEKLAGHPRIRVIGETGLDHYWIKDSLGSQAQEVSFRRHIDLAKRLGKVLQIHDRDAHDEVLRVLHDEGAPSRTVFHCFSGDVEMARHCARQGWYLSFAGNLTFRNAESLREGLRSVPLDQVLVETDAPYLAPVPYRGKPNAGYLLPVTVRLMAEVLQRDLRDVCRVLDRTCTWLYGPW
jgi:TatD DNase family protein